MNSESKSQMLFTFPYLHVPHFNKPQPYTNLSGETWDLTYQILNQIYQDLYILVFDEQYPPHKWRHFYKRLIDSFNHILKRLWILNQSASPKNKNDKPGDEFSKSIENEIKTIQNESLKIKEDLNEAFQHSSLHPSHQQRLLCSKLGKIEPRRSATGAAPH